MLKRLIIISVLLILCIGTASADENVTDDIISLDNNIEEPESVDARGNTFDDIQKTINDAQINSTINLNGTYTGLKEITIKKDITLEGNGATLDGQHSSRILKIKSGNVVLKNINFINAKTMTNGGAIYSNGKLTIINCSFINNSVHFEYDWYYKNPKYNFEPDEIGEGGAIYANRDLKIMNSSFINNSAININMIREMDWDYPEDEGDAGAVLCKGRLHLEKSSFSNNSASAIVTYGNTKVMDCVFENQSSSFSAHGDSNIIFSNSRFSNCGKHSENAEIHTGYDDMIQVHINSCNFTNGHNGIIRIYPDGKLSILNSRFINNQFNYSLYGTTLIEVDNYANITNSTFINNSVKNTGVLELKSYDLKECVFINNTDATIRTKNIMLDDSLNQTYLFEAKIRKNITHTYYGSGDMMIIDLVNLRTGEILEDFEVDHKIYRNGKRYYQEYFYDSLTFPVSKWKTGTYTVVVKYLNSYVQPKEISFEIAVKKAPTVVKAPKVTNKKYFKVKVTHRITKKPVKNTLIKLKIGKNTYKVKTNKKGIAKFNTKKLNTGKHKVTITSGDSNYKINGKSTIITR